MSHPGATAEGWRVRNLPSVFGCYNKETPRMRTFQKGLITSKKHFKRKAKMRKADFSGQTYNF
jgi:hypothetical protein